MKAEIERIIDDLETKKDQCSPFMSQHLSVVDAYFDKGKIDAFDYAIDRLKELI